MAGLKVPYRHRWVGRVENARGVLLKTIRLVLLWRHTHASCKPVSKVTSRLLKNGPRNLHLVPVALFLLPENTFGSAV